MPNKSEENERADRELARDYVAQRTPNQANGNALDYRNWQIVHFMKDAFIAGMEAERDKARK